VVDIEWEQKGGFDFSENGYFKGFKRACLPPSGGEGRDSRLKTEGQRRQKLKPET